MTLLSNNSCADGDDDHGGKDHVGSDNRNDPGDQDASDLHMHDVLHPDEQGPKARVRDPIKFRFSFCGRFKSFKAPGWVPGVQRLFQGWRGKAGGGTVREQH